MRDWNEGVERFKRERGTKEAMIRKGNRRETEGERENEIERKRGRKIERERERERAAADMMKYRLRGKGWIVGGILREESKNMKEGSNRVKCFLKEACHFFIFKHLDTL